MGLGLDTRVEAETGIVERMGNLWGGFTPDGDMGEAARDRPLGW